MSDNTNYDIIERAINLLRRGQISNEECIEILRNNASHIVDDHLELFGLDWIREDDHPVLIELVKLYVPEDPEDAKMAVEEIIFTSIRQAQGLPVLIALLGDVDESTSSCVHEHLSNAAKCIFNLVHWSLRDIIKSSRYDKGAVVPMIEFMANKEGARAPSDIRDVYARHLEELFRSQRPVYDLLMSDPKLWGWGHPDEPCINIKPASRKNLKSP